MSPVLSRGIPGKKKKQKKTLLLKKSRGRECDFEESDEEITWKYIGQLGRK